MDILDIIDKKEKGEKLTKEELQYVIDGYLDGTIKDYQMSALLTEIDLLGLKEEETINLTDIMLHSGEILDLGFDNIVDKHSTGGVGDKTTIVLAPLVASLGVKVAKMSGRGLGHTGGTIDKLESIQGFKTSMSLDEFKNQVSSVEKINTYAENWKDCYNNQDFDGMEKAYNKLKDELDKTLPLKNTLKEARNIENIHILIKNKGGDFNLSQEELELAQKLVM